MLQRDNMDTYQLLKCRVEQMNNHEYKVLWNIEILYCKYRNSIVKDKYINDVNKWMLNEFGLVTAVKWNF